MSKIKPPTISEKLLVEYLVSTDIKTAADFLLEYTEHQTQEKIDRLKFLLELRYQVALDKYMDSNTQVSDATKYLDGLINNMDNNA